MDKVKIYRISWYTWFTAPKASSACKHSYSSACGGWLGSRFVAFTTLEYNVQSLLSFSEDLPSHVRLQCAGRRWGLLPRWWLHRQRAAHWWRLDVWHRAENRENGHAPSELHWVCELILSPCPLSFILMYSKLNLFKEIDDTFQITWQLFYNNVSLLWQLDTQVPGERNWLSGWKWQQP